MSAGCPTLCRMPLSSLPGSPDLLRRLALGRRLRTMGLGLVVLVDAVYATSGFDGRRAAAAGLTPSMDEPTSGTGMLIALVGIAFVVAVQWRQRWPVALALLGVAGVVRPARTDVRAHQPHVGRDCAPLA